MVPSPVDDSVTTLMFKALSAIQGRHLERAARYLSDNYLLSGSSGGGYVTSSSAGSPSATPKMVTMVIVTVK